MNYSTIKKAVACSLVAAMGFTAASAQDTTSTTTAATSTSSAKVFGGRGQYRTWSFGLNAGVLSPVVFVGGSNDFTNWNAELGYGATLRKQVGHSFGIELSFLRGEISGTNEDAVGGVQSDRRTFDAQLGWSGAVMGVINVATIDFLKRENNVNFLVKGGYGIAGYTWKLTTGNNTEIDAKGTYGDDGDRDYIREQFIPVGAGVKFKLSDRINFDLGYNMYFIDGDNLDGTYAKGTSKDKFSYAYGGLEFSLGSSAKPNLDWVNPVALMYDELKDPTLRQEVEALKGRVSTIEATVNDLLKDSDGDGVADKLDKCPNTEAGVKVDGSGCPLDVDADGIVDSKDACPTEKGTAEYNGCPATAMVGESEMIQFEFNSSVLRTSAYPVLDKWSAALRSGAAGTTAPTTGADTAATDTAAADTAAAATTTTTPAAPMAVSSILLEGHASAEGTEEYNMQLSVDRANSVKTYLVNSGVDASKISTKGFGETRPVTSNATEAGRSKNRRVEIKRQ